MLTTNFYITFLPFENELGFMDADSLHKKVVKTLKNVPQIVFHREALNAITPIC